MASEDEEDIVSDGVDEADVDIDKILYPEHVQQKYVIHAMMPSDCLQFYLVIVFVL